MDGGDAVVAGVFQEEGGWEAGNGSGGVGTADGPDWFYAVLAGRRIGGISVHAATSGSEFVRAVAGSRSAVREGLRREWHPNLIRIKERGLLYRPGVVTIRAMKSVTVDELPKVWVAVLSWLKAGESVELRERDARVGTIQPEGAALDPQARMKREEWLEDLRKTRHEVFGDAMLTPEESEFIRDRGDR